MLRGHPAILCTVLWSRLRLFKLGGHFPGLNFKTGCFMYWEEINVPLTFYYCFCACLHHCPVTTHLCVVCRHFIVLCCNFKDMSHVRILPPLIFRPSWGLTGLKKIFFNVGPPITSGSGWPALPSPPLIWRSGSATVQSVLCICVTFAFELSAVFQSRKLHWSPL